jgi:hypothetical protein
MLQVNSHIDYEEFVKNKKKIHKTFIEPGNKLSIYRNPINRGVFDFNDGKKHKVKIDIYDAHLNKAEVQFYIQSSAKIDFPAETYTSFFRFDKRNEFDNDEVELDVPDGTFFTDLKFNYSMIPGNSKTFSNIQCLHNNLVPLNKPAKIEIKPKSLPANLRGKALIALIDLSNNSLSSLGGEYSFGWVKSTTRIFGNMCVVVDTLAPTITPLSISSNKTFTEAGQIRFRIKDNLSGIKNFNGYIDGNWVLFEYDAKTNLITYHFDEYIKKGNRHQLKLVVSDQKENLNEYHATFFY